MNTTVKFGLSALAGGALFIWPAGAEDRTINIFTKHGLPIPGAYFKSKESQQLVRISKSKRASEKRQSQRVVKRRPSMLDMLADKGTQ